jgi:multiple sugar transport system substrate-binding protein
MYNAVVKAFMAENPDVVIRARGLATYADLMQQNLRDQITGSLPDVSHDALNFVRLYAEKGMATALDSRIGNDDAWSVAGYPESIRRVGAVGGQIYAVPFAISTQTLFFNLDLVRQAGGDPDRLPTQWPEIISLAKAISGLGGKVSGIYFDYGASAALAFQTLLFSQGGSMMSSDERRVAFDGPEGQWSMDLLRQFGEAGQMDMTRDNAKLAFVSGMLGIYQNTSSNLGNFDKQIAGRFAYAMIPVPKRPEGRLPAAGNGMLMLAKDEARRDAAWRYMTFAAGAKGQAIMARMSGYVPIAPHVLDDPTMKTFYETHPNYAVALDQIKDLTAWYLFPGPNGVKASDAIMVAMGDAVTLRKPPQQALSEAAGKVRALIGAG